MSNLQPTRIVDKNGRETTVYASKGNTQTVSSRVSGLPNPTHAVSEGKPERQVFSAKNSAGGYTFHYDDDGKEVVLNEWSSGAWSTKQEGGLTGSLKKFFGRFASPQK